jgi:hypothetical protein
VSQKNDHEDSIVLLLRRIRQQLDQLTSEIEIMLADEDLRRGNEGALARYDEEADG